MTILPWVLLCSGYGFLVTLIYELGEWQGFYKPAQNGSEVIPDLILSFNIVLSLLLGLRTNSANDRFWEGRKLWGSFSQYCP